MGVHGLWELLAPVGRRVSVETLAGKKLAIDASIWMIQFMKAMRDERGEMVRNAHILGFFRRICKLLFLRTKPVFVFDGGTPALKRRTVIARRRQRENAQAKIRKTAEKLLLNHLKAMRLKELAVDLENQRKKNVDKGKKVSIEDLEIAGNSSGATQPTSKSYDQEAIDAMLAASIEAEQHEGVLGDASTSGAGVAVEEEDDDDDDEEMLLPTLQGAVDPAVIAALPPSIQLDLLREKNGDKGKKMSIDNMEISGSSSGTNQTVSNRYNQEAIDAMLAASIEAEEDEGFLDDASTSAAGIVEEDEDDGDDDEEMLLPTLEGKVDPAVLAALPPSMQLDLLVQMRERLMAENRQKYQKVKKAPARFSELQIQAYLKTVAFRREIDEVRKAAGGKGIGGVQTSRIASEANREFIFSSSFTGNRQAFASAGAEGNNNAKSQIPAKRPPIGSVNGGISTNKSNNANGSVENENAKAFNEDVETYLDERGRVRVSKVRAMGIRMTRDLQRNLDLMKEIEQQKADPGGKSSDKTNKDKATPVPGKPSKNSKVIETSFQENDGSVCSNKSNQQYIPINGTSIEVSFVDDGEQKFGDSYDDIFAHIVAGDPLGSLPADNTSSGKEPDNPFSDCEWEEGLPEDVEVERPLADRSISDESDVEWEEGPSDDPEQPSAHEVKDRETVSKGASQEEADFQEAMRRSMEDIRCQKDIGALSASEELKDDKMLASECSRFVPKYIEKYRAAPKLASESIFPPNRPSGEVLPEIDDEEHNMAEVKISKEENSPTIQLGPSNSNDRYFMRVEIEKPCESHQKSHTELVRKDATVDWNSQGENSHIHLVNRTEDDGVESSKHEIDPKGNTEALVSSSSFPSFTSHISNSSNVDIPDVGLTGSEHVFGPLVSGHVSETAEAKESAVEESKSENVMQKVTKETDSNANYNLGEEAVDKFGLADMSKEQVEIAEASLEEELINLTKERTDLGDEQRRLERNAESVSGEMFAECQELLQMFGLPYIIAPMEAEAQCAFMELENLVDGVVTDDSDVFLFGARSVYKNIFDDRKYVETYFMKDIETELGLTREKLIRTAMLLGSDYTEGISGIGIVNAVEVLNAFPEEDGLHKFREWVESPDPTILGKVDIQAGSTTRKRGSNSNTEGPSKANQGTLDSDDDIQSWKQIFMDKHRNVSKNWHIPSTFPSDAVISAYASPQVDKSTEPFSWGKPDLFVLRKLCWEKFGWSTQKADELLQPVLKEYNKHETQLRLEAFYTFNERFAKIRSKRINKAVKGIAGSRPSELTDDTDLGAPKRRNRRKLQNMESEDDRAKEQISTVEQFNSTEKLESSVQGGKKNNRDRSSVRGRRRGRAGGSCQSIGRGRTKTKTKFSGTSSDDGKNSVDVQEVQNSVDVQEVQAEQYNGQREARRSKRARKSVKYTMSEDEIDEPRTSEDYAKAAEDEQPSNGEATLVNAAAMDASKIYDHEFEQSSHEVRLSDNVEVGGGFCMDEAELDPVTGQQEWVQNDDITLEPESSKEYLKMGGGFCLDEEGVGKEPGNSTCSPTRMVDLESGTTKELNELPDGDGAEASVNWEKAGSATITSTPLVALSLENIEKDDSGRPASYLSAIPNLRRKRRKT